MEHHNSVLESSVLQYLEDMQKSMCDNNVNYSNEHYLIPSPPKSPRADYYGDELFDDEFCAPSASLFDENFKESNRASSKYGMADESSKKEEFKEENDFYRKTVRSHLKSESKWEIEGESQSDSKHVLTNKERARIARKRKKQYYEDLEARNKFLENRVKQLTDELEQCRSKVLFGDGYPPPKELKLDKGTCGDLSNDCVKMLRCWPEESHVFQIHNKTSKASRPFGTNKLNKLDQAFDTIVDNMYCGGTKLMLYVIDKDIPKTRAEYESYSKLGKFQRHAKYPDPLVRQYIENNLLLNLNNEQYQDLIQNQLKQMGDFKKEVKEAVTALYDAKFKIYKSIMLHDLLKTKLTLKTISKNQLLNMAQNMKKHECVLSYDQIFDIKRKEISVEVKIPIPDPKAFAKAAIHGVEKSENGELPSCVSDVYQTTIYSVDSK